VRNGTTWSQQAYLKASNTETFDYFGYALAVSGDTVVVGAPLEDSQATGMNGDLTDNSAPNSGAVYVFVRNGTDWTQQAYLKASNTGASDYFGASVALSNDTLVVAAHQEDSGATGVNGNQSNDTAADSGAAYVFVRNGTNWSQQAYLKASNTGANDYFGISVALWGETLLVGAHLEASNATGVNGNQTSNSASESGAAYLFVRNGTNWTQQAYVKASNTGGGDNFGVSVGVSAGTMAIGAWYEDSNATGVDGNQNDNSATDSGAAYVFRVSPAGPPELHLSGVRDGNTFQLVASGTPSTQWRLEFRDTLAELSSWQPLTNSILSSSPVVVSQTFDGIQRFYRGTWVP